MLLLLIYSDEVQDGLYSAGVLKTRRVVDRDWLVENIQLDRGMITIFTCVLSFVLVFRINLAY